MTLEGHLQEEDLVTKGNVTSKEVRIAREANNHQDGDFKGNGHAQEECRNPIRMMVKDTAQGTSEAS